VTVAHLQDFHGDAADCLIYATADTRQLPLITKGARLHNLATTAREVTVLWLRARPAARRSQVGKRATRRTSGRAVVRAPSAQRYSSSAKF